MRDENEGWMRDVGLLLLRAAAGSFLLIAHGRTKLDGFADLAPTFPDPLGLGSSGTLLAVIFAETVCAAMVALGLGTRLACIPLIGAMAMAAFLPPGADALGKRELALLYLLAFSTVALTGPGRLSFDHWRARQRAMGAAFPAA